MVCLSNYDNKTLVLIYFCASESC